MLFFGRVKAKELLIDSVRETGVVRAAWRTIPEKTRPEGVRGSSISYGRPTTFFLLRAWLLGAVLLAVSSFGAHAATTLTTLHSFQWFTNGATPEDLVHGSDGNYYGTTAGGGSNNFGTVFKITTNGALTTLHSFTGGNDGGNPYGALIQGSDGNLYGTASVGGASHLYGTVYKVGTNGGFTSLYSFTGGVDGSKPYGGLLQTSDGELYGTATAGGTSTWGTIFKLSTNGVLTNMYSFLGGNDGAEPYATMTHGADGNLYGTTRFGGTNNYGTVFKITTNGGFSSLYSFNFSDGQNPQAALVQGLDNNFYGTTHAGGANNDGTVFKIAAGGAFTSLYSFTGGADGANPFAALVQTSDSMFYGTTASGGTANQGTMFKMTAGGALTNLYSFTGGSDGGDPAAALVPGGTGLFYSTAATHGSTTANSAGTVYKITTNGAPTGLFTFTCSSEGSVPYAGLTAASDGLLYGTLNNGGTNNNGTIYKISTNGTLTGLYSFSGADGKNPEANLVQGTDGHLYGTTYAGGSNNQGTVFKLTTNGTLTSLYSFAGSDGANPQSSLVQSGTNFFGTTYYGGANFQGSVFKISMNGSFSNLYSFTGNNDGGNPAAGLVRGNDGNLYGTTYQGGTNGYGTVFQITTNGGFTSLYSFSGDDGAYPEGGVVQAADGYFYGTTQYGGSNFVGNIFKISAGGDLTDLYDFTGGVDGENPYAGLIQAVDGNLYGTTYFGGVSGNGSVFRISTLGAFTSLYSFVGAIGGNDGLNPQCTLLQGADGAFYGTTLSGGLGGDITAGGGTVFRLSSGEAAPVFQMATLTGKTVNLTWSTSPGGVYQLQFKTNLSTGTWSNLGSAVTAAGTIISTNDSTTNGVRRFYRAVLIP